MIDPKELDRTTGCIIVRDWPQKSPQWIEARRGILTASNLDQVLSPAKLEVSKSAQGLSLIHI